MLFHFQTKKLKFRSSKHLLKATTLQGHEALGLKHRSVVSKLYLEHNAHCLPRNTHCILPLTYVYDTIKISKQALRGITTAMYQCEDQHSGSSETFLALYSKSSWARVGIQVGLQSHAPSFPNFCDPSYCSKLNFIFAQIL